MNGIVHFEIPADDIERAKAFYTKAFGWQIKTDKMPDGADYNAAITTPTGVDLTPKKPGEINGALIQRDEKLKAPLITVGVDSVEEAIKKVTDAGGKVVLPRNEVPGMGEYAYVADPEGNTIGLWHSF